jgi:HlyD family secretion protein
MKHIATSVIIGALLVVPTVGAASAANPHPSTTSGTGQPGSNNGISCGGPGATSAPSGASNFVKASGTVEAVVSVDVSSQLSGRIAEVFVDFNDSVKAGQAIAKIDQEIFAARVNEAKAALSVADATAEVQKAALERARVAVANAQTAKKQAEAQSVATKARQDEAEREFQRKLELARTGSGTERELGQARAIRDAGAGDQRASLEQIEMKTQAIAIAEAEERMGGANVQNAQAVVEQRQAALDQARLDLERTVLRAPIDGVIIKRDVNPGQTVAVSLEAKTLFKIANDLREMEVHGKIDEADVGQLKVGQAAQFTVDAYPDRTFSGRVIQIRKSPEIVQNVVTYTAIISAPNPDLLMLPGMTAQLRIAVSDTVDVLKIPNQWPRGRIVYETPTCRFVLYADRRLQKPDVIDALKTAFGLNETEVIVRSDSHYR